MTVWTLTRRDGRDADPREDEALVEELARAILRGRLCLAWGSTVGEQRLLACWPSDDKAWRAYNHNPHSDVELALASARAVIALLGRTP